jgi:hypothetical protein
MAWLGSGLGLLAAAGSLGLGCAVTTAANEDGVERDAAGGMELALTWGHRDFSEVEYQIATDGGELAYEGVIDISASDYWVSTFIEGIAPGEYMLALRATSNDGARSCRGTASFTVMIGQTTYVNALIVCSADRRTGAVAINAQFDDCTGYIQGVTAEPVIAQIGQSIALAVSVAPGFGTFQWTATQGSFDYPSAPEAQYTCTEVGTHAITITVTSYYDELCEPDVRELLVQCLGVP